MVNILGTDVRIEIIAAVLSSISILGAVVLTHILSSRKQLKDILKRLGAFEHITLEAMIGSAIDKGILL